MDYRYEVDGNKFNKIPSTSKVPVTLPDKQEPDSGTELQLTVFPFDHYEYDSCSLTNTELKESILENFKNVNPAFPTDIPWNNYETLIGLMAAAGDLQRTDSYGLGISEMTIEHLAELLRRQIVNLVG